MKEDDIIKTLISWNFWGERLEVGISRDAYVKEALCYLKTKKVVTITGIRRAGKSFISKQIVTSFVEDKNNSLIINFEEVRFDEALDEKFLVKIYDAYLSVIKPNEKPLIILDEIQEVKSWERFVRSVNEKNEAYLIVTGSSAKIMGEELATLLTGRTLTLEVFPLTFTEFLQFKGLKIRTKFEFIKKADEINDLFKEYVSFGGFPEVILEKDKGLKLKILSAYYQDILNKDIVKRFKIRRIDKLERIAFYYLTNFSSPITFNSIGKFLRFEEKTVEIYSKHIESGKLIFFLRRFSSSIKEQENSPRKCYVTDIGFHNLSNILFSDKIAKIYENIVAIQLFKKEGKNLFYWKDYSGKEVDFVIKRGLKINELIQVCYNIEDFKTKEREIRALIKASKELKCGNLLVITESKEAEEKIGNKRVKYVPLWKWLLENE